MYARITTWLVLFLVASAVASPCTAGEARDGMLIHITAGPDDPHRVLMALHMAELMSTDHPTLVYLDIDAVYVVLKGATVLEHAPFPNSKQLLASLLDKGVQIMACPGCLQAAGKSADDLQEGIHVADKAAFFELTSGRVITLDY